MGTNKLTDSSAAFLFEVPELDSPLRAQELQIAPGIETTTRA
jgi:hypothetical protein